MSNKLPETAYRKLEQGETYQPVLSPDKTYKEATLYSVSLGIFFAIIFTLALMYLALKLGIGISADTPVAIIGVGLAMALRRPEPLGENIIMQYIPYTASAVMAAATFIFPAFIILGFKVSYLDLLITLILGGCLGTLISVIFRRYFVEDMHGAYPFPGSFATSEILLSAEGSSAKTMLVSGVVGFIYDFITGCLGWWNETFSTKAFDWGNTIAEKYKMALSIDVSAAFVGIGYLTGLRYSSIISAGSLFGGFVIIPLISMYLTPENTPMFGTAAPEIVYAKCVKFIGVGALATSGMIGLIKMLNIIWKSMFKAVRDIFVRHESHAETHVRTQLDLHMKTVMIGSIVILIAVFFFLYFRITQHSLLLSGISVVIVLVFSFLFSIIAATSIAYTNNEPVSGMTILMMITSAVIFGSIGLSGNFAAILILFLASIVCAMLGQSGYIAGAYKIGYLLGATPRKLEIWGLISVFLTSPIILIAFVILTKAYGFTGASALAAPQGNAMAGILQPILSGHATPWIFYIIGAFIAIIISICGIPPLPFAMGIYLPMQLAIPFIIGGFLSWLVSPGSGSEKFNFKRKQKGTVVASGLIAGGAIAGIVSAVLQILGKHFECEDWLSNDLSKVLGLCALIVLSWFIVTYSRNIKEDGTKDN